MTRLRTWTVVALAASSLGLAACGSSSSSSTTTTAASTQGTAKPGIGTIADPSAAGTIGTEPTITVPPGAPPNQLETKDLIVGTGPAIKAGDKATVQYVGVAYSSKQVFDSSWSRNQPFAFVLGKGSVIPGWDIGVVGMCGRSSGNHHPAEPGLRPAVARLRDRGQRHARLHRRPREDQLSQGQQRRAVAVASRT